MKEALKLALDALLNIVEGSRIDSVGNRNDDGLIDHNGHHDFKKRINAAHAAITVAKTALAQPEQEPVGEVVNATDKAFECKFVKILPIGTKLYTAPPQRKPLTHLEIWNTYKNLWMFHPAEEPRLAGDVLKFARAIEAAHGIKENT